MKPCKYNDPNCTGRHTGSTLKSEMCPSAYRWKLEWYRERWATDPEFRERKRERNRERWATDPEFRERKRWQKNKRRLENRIAEKEMQLEDMEIVVT